MIILGALVNGVAAVLGGVIGTFAGSRIKQDLADFLTVATGLSVVFLGISGMFGDGSVMVVTLSMVIGAAIGHMLDIDAAIKRLGDRIQATFDARSAQTGKQSNISQGFVNATLVICIGSMAIMGSLQSGLMQDHSTLYTKALMDFIINIVIAATSGIGVALSGIPVFLYEAAMSLAASAIAPFLTEVIITNIVATGSILITALGLNMIHVTDIKIANLLPAVLVPIFITGLFV